jgi:hypothetical protein
MRHEDLYIKQIENGIRAIRIGTKEPKDTKLTGFFDKLKPLNEGMYLDLLQKYKNVVNDFNKNKDTLN